MAAGGNQVLRVGVVGCGGMGMKHLRVLSELPGTEIVGACDLSSERLGAIPRELVPPDARFASHAEMYARGALDLAVVATPPTGRLSPVVDALAGGIPVLCEKPLATDLHDADRMVEAAARSGAFLAVHHQYRVSAALERCRSMIASGAIGEIVMLRGRGKAGRPGGVELLEIGTHLADLMAALVGPAQWCSATILAGRSLAEASDVQRCTEVAPSESDLGPVAGTRISATYGFAGGILGEMHFLGHEARMPENYGIDIEGTSGQLALRCSRHVDAPLWHLARPQAGTPGQLRDWQAVEVSGPGNRGLVEAFYQRVLDAIRSGGTPPCDASDGRRAVEMVLGAFRSHREGGRRVDLPATERDSPLEQWSREPSRLRVPQ